MLLFLRNHFFIRIVADNEAAAIVTPAPTPTTVTTRRETNLICFSMTAKRPLA